MKKKKNVEINSDTHPLICCLSQTPIWKRAAKQGCSGESHMREFNSSGSNQVTFHSSRLTTSEHYKAIPVSF